MHPISYATQYPSCPNVELFSLPRRNDVSDGIQADYPLPLVRLCTRERSILGSKREPSRLASLQLLVGPKRTILVIKMELGREERWLAVELFLFFFSLDAAAIAEAPAGLRIAEPSFVNPNQGHGRHG